MSTGQQSTWYFPSSPPPAVSPTAWDGSQSQLTTPLHPHRIATIALTLSRGLDRGLGNVRVKHAPHGVLGHSKVEAFLPWPQGYHSTFILSPTLDPDEGASWSGCFKWGRGLVWGRLTSPSQTLHFHFALGHVNSIACPALSVGISVLLPILFLPDHFSSLVKPLRLFGIIIRPSQVLFTSLSNISLYDWYRG